MENLTKQQLAEQLCEALILKTRDNSKEFYCLKDGSGEAFYCLKDDAPQWMTDAVRACHDNGDELPNDWHYAFISESAATLAASDDWDDLPYPEADIYNHDLIKWLGEFPNAPWYCDQADNEGMTSHDDGIIPRIVVGQAYAKQETLSTLQSFLETLADNAEAV